MAKKKKVLGRGLGALLSDSPDNKKNKPKTPVDKDKIDDVEDLDDTSDLDTEPVPSANNINHILLEHIEVNPFQPRTEFDQDALNDLAESIKVQGIIQPITVRQLAKNQYQLISGERRLHASKLAQLEEIPAYIRTANDQQMLEMALIENIQRENLNPMEIALSYQRLLSECDLKQEQLGERVGKRRATVTNYLRLLKLPPQIQAALRDKKIGMGHARAMAGVENVDDQLSIFDKTIKDQLSVRAVEALVRKLNEPNKTPAKATDIDIEMKKVQGQLSSHFGTKIQLKSKDNNKGEIKIPFTSVDDLNRILEILNL